ncbi:MAG TPA: ATP-binding protein [Acidimicrobiales bacterium]|nr:ATP-binding protein [Acidimicrobiales bacterium]
MLRADARSAGRARAFVRDALRRWGCHHMVELTVLVANEVVTNAILHARSEVGLRVRLSEGYVRVEVTDRSHAEPVRRSTPDDATGGRGIALLDATATRWGVDLLPEGKRVWFDMAL